MQKKKIPQTRFSNVQSKNQHLHPQFSLMQIDFHACNAPARICNDKFHTCNVDEHACNRHID